VASEDESGGEKADLPAPRTITDARTMRALAHPVRVALLELLVREGQLTATRAAELLDDSPGNMSWHLQTLARYGFVEEAEGGRGRSRPWRVVSTTNSFDTSSPVPEVAAAGTALEASFQARSNEMLREWWSSRGSYAEEWRRAAFGFHTVLHLNAEEMTQLGEEIRELLARYRGRSADRALWPAGSMPVHFSANSHPLPPATDGN
jgi:DNA-binding transcriptional ArsR family regulator